MNNQIKYLISPYVFAGLESMYHWATSTDKLIAAICTHAGVSVEQMKSKSRKKKILMSRYYYFYIQRIFIRKETLKEIGKEFGWRDHSTVINAINSFSNMLETDSEIRNDFMEFLKSVSYSWHIQFTNSLPVAAKPIKLAAIPSEKSFKLPEDFGKQIFFKP